MKKFCFWNVILFIGLAMITLTTTSCIRTSKSDEPIIAYDVKTKPFIKLDISAVAKVIIRQGNTYAVKITTTEKTYKRIHTEWSKDSVLTIYYTNVEGKNIKIIGFNNVKSNGTTIEITAPNLSHIYFNGVGTLTTDTPYKADSLSLEINGMVKAYINKVIANRFAASVDGISKLSIDTLTAKKSFLELGGIGKVDFHFVQSDEAEVSVDGICKATLTGTLKQVPIVNKDGITQVSDKTERW